MSVRAVEWGDGCGPVVDNVEPERKRLLMTTFLIDLNGQEDLYLAEVAKAEAGATITDLYNNHIHVYLYPDNYPNQVILEDMGDSALDGAEGPRRCTYLTLAATRQLILDWLAAKEQWYRQKDQSAQRAGAK